MRRAAALAVLLTLAGAGPVPGAVAWQRASLISVRIEGDRATAYIAVAARRADEGGLVTVAGVGRLRCRVERGRRFTNAICNGRVAVEQVPMGAFDIHPTLDYAELETTSGGRTTAVRWEARDRRPNAGVPISVDPKHTVVRVLLWRDAKAFGRVAGARLRPQSHWDRADLSQSAGLEFGIPADAGRHRIRITVGL